MNKIVKFGGLGCLVIIGLFVIIGIIGAFFSPTEKTEKVSSSSSQESTEVVEIEKIESEPELPKSRWVYETQTDKMGDAKKFAMVESDDILDFEFPYNGGATSRLTIRKGPNETDIYYQVSKGQIIAAYAYDGGTIRVKFDDEKPMTIGVNGPSDHSSDIIFLDSTSKLIKKIKNAKKMILEVEFYNEGNRQIEFDVSGLEW